MAKLYFRYGTMSSAKTLNLLAVAHNYRHQGKKVLLLKPALDVRFGRGSIRSRAGLEQEADQLVEPSTILNDQDYAGVNCILVDEAQFLLPRHVDELRDVATRCGVPVICYGLRTDFQSHLFDGARRLMELADAIEEVKTTCAFCNRKATMNLRHVNGKAVVTGNVVDIGADDRYFAACYSCYRSQIEAAQAGIQEPLL